MQWRPIRPETARERFIGKNTGGQRVTRAQLMSRRKTLIGIRPQFHATTSVFFKQF